MFDINNLTHRMLGAVEALNRELAGIRAGRVSPDFLNAVIVDVYGSKVPINQVGSVSVAGNRSLTVQVWDKGSVKSVETAIQNSDLGVSIQSEGQLIRVNIPDLSEERRKELCKLAAKYAEHAKVAVRNVRRDGMDELKKMEKNKEISEDESKREATNVQKLTDDFILKIDSALSAKEADILKV